MKKLSFLFKIISILRVVPFTSCMPLYTAIGGNYGIAKEKEVYGDVVHAPIVADLDIARMRTTASITLPKNEFISHYDARKYALQKFLADNNADILIAPQYKFVEKDNIFIISGYLANYKNFRNFEPKDTLFLKIDQHIERYEEQRIITTEQLPLSSASTNQGVHLGINNKSFQPINHTESIPPKGILSFNLPNKKQYCSPLEPFVCMPIRTIRFVPAKRF